MKLYKTTILPVSHFASAIRGDTLFGHICWAIRFRYGKDRLEALLKEYATTPFLVVSDPFVPGYFPKPKAPSFILQEESEKKKENRKKIWLTYEELRNGEFQKARTSKELGLESEKAFEVVRNSINYLKFTTEGKTFAPYGVLERHYEAKEIYFLLNEDLLSPDELLESLKIVGELGYGKDSAIGKGRFECEKLEPWEPPKIRTKTYMALSPFALADKEAIARCYYEPYVKFGKFGALRAQKSAFKKPLLMFDTAALIQYKEPPQKPYEGRAITGISSAYEDAVHQGYTILLPIKDLV
jgi:CRISPR-associated protein Csm4